MIIKSDIALALPSRFRFLSAEYNEEQYVFMKCSEDWTAFDFFMCDVACERLMLACR